MDLLIVVYLRPFLLKLLSTDFAATFLSRTEVISDASFLAQGAKKGVFPPIGIGTQL